MNEGAVLLGLYLPAKCWKYNTHEDTNSWLLHSFFLPHLSSPIFFHLFFTLQGCLQGRAGFTKAQPTACFYKKILIGMQSRTLWNNELSIAAFPLTTAVLSNYDRDCRTWKAPNIFIWLCWLPNLGDLWHLRYLATCTGLGWTVPGQSHIYT